MAHRLALKMTIGKEPREIDHIDGDGCNNRLGNLREVDHATNQQNRNKANSRKHNLPLGVALNSHGKKYRAYCGRNGKYLHLGNYDTVEDAESAYQAYRAKDSELVGVVAISGGKDVSES
jgi:hypothetical protein